MKSVYDKLMNCYESFQKKIDFKPQVAIILGSGLGEFANEIKVVHELPYDEIEGFPVSTVAGHAGKFIFGFIGDIPVVCMKGRIHYYEGYSMQDVVLPARLMKLMGAKILFLTNAAGGIHKEWNPGSLMMITDHISAIVPNPLIGQNIEQLGTRFPDMSEIYDKELREILRSTAAEHNITLQEGVYMQFTGPSYESPAEVQFAKTAGADAVGMSTAVEAIAANHMGMKICGISCVTNVAAGVTGVPLSHEEVQAAADIAAEKFKVLVKESVLKFKTFL